jgi:hypothetical protein
VLEILVLLVREVQVVVVLVVRVTIQAVQDQWQVDQDLVLVVPAEELMYIQQVVAAVVAILGAVVVMAGLTEVRLAGAVQDILTLLTVHRLQLLLDLVQTQETQVMLIAVTQD